MAPSDSGSRSRSSSWGLEPPSKHRRVDDAKAEIPRIDVKKVPLSLRDKSTAILQFLSSSEPLPPPQLEWEPSEEHWSDIDVERLSAMNIPYMPYADGAHARYPDMNLAHVGSLECLDPSFPERHASFLRGTDHLLVVNTSGSGKTRMVFETLHGHWGLYLTGTYDDNVEPYGSKDLLSSLQFLDKSDFRLRVDLDPASPDFMSSVRFNRTMTANEVSRLLYSRLLILDHFLDLAGRAEISDHDARVKWFWLQLHSPQILGTDIFLDVLSTISSRPVSEAEDGIVELEKKHRDKLRFVALDEAQALNAQFTTSFCGSDGRSFRPILREIVLRVAQNLPFVRTIVSGTCVDIDAVTEGIEASSTNHRQLRKFCDLGEFRTDAAIKDYAEYFLGSLPDDVLTAITQLFKGRHRFLAVFVQYVLVYGKKRSLEIANKIVATTTGFRRSKAKSTLRVELGLILDDNQMEESSLAREFRSALFSRLALNEHVVFNYSAADLVHYGLAHFTSDTDHASIDEPLPLLTIARWIQRSKSYSTGALLARRAKDPSMNIAGHALPHGVAFYLWKQLSGTGVRLDSIADFPGDAPAWAQSPAKLALTAVGDDGLRTFTPVDKRLSPPVTVARDARSTLAWLRNARTPFLIPDDQMGAQLAFLLAVGDHHRLVFLHLEPFSSPRPHRNATISPISPNKFYAEDRESRTAFREILATFSRDGEAGAVDAASSSGSSKRSIKTLQIYCFARLHRSDSAYDPPACALRVRDIAQPKRTKANDLSLEPSFEDVIECLE